jgi:hypothetical protein
MNIMALVILGLACLNHFFQLRRVRRIINEQAQRALEMKKQFESSASGLSEKSREKYRRRIKAASANRPHHLDRQWFMYFPFLVTGLATTAFGFLLWVAAAGAAAGAGASEPFVGQLPPMHDVSVRDDVKLWYAFASSFSVTAGAFVVLRLHEIAVAAGYYQIKIPGVTPDRVKIGDHSLSIMEKCNNEKFCRCRQTQDV